MILMIDEVESNFSIDFFEMLSKEVFSKVGYNCKVEVSLLLTSDEIIKELNNQYRNKDKPTDVLSFPMEDKLMLGDIAISIDTAKKQAEEREIALEREVAFLFIHGLLHLLGYDHETSIEDEKEMFELQENILKDLVDKGKIA